MARETKIGFALIVVLLTAFGLVVYQKQAKQQELIAQLEEHQPQNDGDAGNHNPVKLATEIEELKNPVQLSPGADLTEDPFNQEQENLNNQPKKTKPKTLPTSFQSNSSSLAKLMPIDVKSDSDQKISSTDNQSNQTDNKTGLPLDIDDKIMTSDQVASNVNDPFKDDFDTPNRPIPPAKQNEDSFEIEVKTDSSPNVVPMPKEDPFGGLDKKMTSSEPAEDQFEEPVKKDQFDPIDVPEKKTETPLPKELLDESRSDESSVQKLPLEKNDFDPFAKPELKGSEQNNTEQKLTPEPVFEKQQPFTQQVPEPLPEQPFPEQPFEKAELPPETEKTTPIQTTEVPFDLDDKPMKTTQIHQPNQSQSTQLYIVQDGDNYWDISKVVYGKGGYFRALARHNLNRIRNPRKLRPGMKVLVPTVDYLTKHYSNDFPVGMLAVVTRSKTTLAPGFRLGASGEPTYIVGDGDTLGSISQGHLGRASRWVQIYQMNRNVITNPKKLKIGTVLQLPADASRVRLVQRD